VGRPEADANEGQNVSLVRQGSGVELGWLDTRTGKAEELV
jgi:hypothetical protein